MSCTCCRVLYTSSCLSQVALAYTRQRALRTSRVPHMTSCPSRVIVSFACHLALHMSSCTSHAIVYIRCHRVLRTSSCPSHVIMSFICYRALHAPWCPSHIIASLTCQHVLHMPSCPSQAVVPRACHRVAHISGSRQPGARTGHGTPSAVLRDRIRDAASRDAGSDPESPHP